MESLTLIRLNAPNILNMYCPAHSNIYKPPPILLWWRFTHASSLLALILISIAITICTEIISSPLFFHRLFFLSRPCLTESTGLGNYQ